MHLGPTCWYRPLFGLRNEHDHLPSRTKDIPVQVELRLGSHCHLNIHIIDASTVSSSCMVPDVSYPNLFVSWRFLRGVGLDTSG